MKTQEMKKLVGSKIFSVIFVKSDGTKRKMHCKVGVKKYLNGGQKTYDDNEANHLTVFDLKSRGYRTVNLNTLIQIKANGKVIKL